MIRFIDENGHTSYWFDTQELSKALNLKDSKGKFVGRNRLYKILRYNKIVDKNNQPTAYFINLGIGKTHSTTKRWKKYNMPIWSERGVEYFKMRFASGKYQIVLEEAKKSNQFVDLNQVC